MKTLTIREQDELNEAKKLALDVARQIETLRKDDLDHDSKELWDLRNFAQQISAVLYNIHHGVYRVRS